MINEKFSTILKQVSQYISKNGLDSLDIIASYKSGIGIEGWLKVEAAAALKNTNYEIKKIQNRGPDLILNDGTEIELKADNLLSPGFIDSVYKYEKCNFALIMGYRPKLDIEGINKEIIEKRINNKKYDDLKFEIQDLGRHWYIIALERNL